MLRLCLGALLATAAQCGRPADPTAPPPAPPAPGATAMTRLLAQQTSAFRTEAEAVARDAAAWRELWGQLHGGAAEAPPPAVDFAREMVVLVALGERATGGYAVRVDDVAADAGTGAVVRYTVTVPGRGCATSQATTAPVDVVRAPRAAGAVRFEARTVPSSC